jgi:hypothetical protein
VGRKGKNSVSALPVFAAALRRKLLSLPGYTSLPVCPRCAKQVPVAAFGTEACKACEAERARVSEEWDAQRDQDIGVNYYRPAPEFPIYGSAEAARPFLPDDQ